MARDYSIEVEHIGRSGYIYYKRDGNTARFEIELAIHPDYQFGIFFNSQKEWFSPAHLPFLKEEKQLIRAHLEDWLSRQTKGNMRID